ncbi:MAG TPA: hypothetical protein VEA17_00350 [Bordetella sp.]|nr:hypothetical protein [Bordetella sp.]
MTTSAPVAPTCGIVGVAAVPHAPQFLSLPDTEDHTQVARVRDAMRAVGERLRTLQPDCIVVVSNDHGDHFVTHSTPAFCVHAADHADGMHKHRGDWALDAGMAYPLVQRMEEEGFDLAFTLGAKLPTAFTIPYEFMGFDREIPMTAIFLNAYVPPQPSPLRCHAFGQALARALTRMGKRAVLIASGGLSHYPGTRHYPHPDVETDRMLHEQMRAGNLTQLLGYDAATLDRTGNLELRMTLAATGAVGSNRKPFISLFEPSWHHTYSVHGWDLTQSETAEPLIYPALPQHRVGLVQAVFTLRIDPASARRFLDDPEAYADSFALAPRERQALVAMHADLNTDRLRDEFALHALLTAGAATQLRLQRNRKL